VDVLDADRLQERARHLAHGVLVVDDEHLERGKLLCNLSCGLIHVAPRSWHERRNFPIDVTTSV
jgi:hypothetical protein